MLKSGYGLDDEAISTWLGDETYEQNLFGECGWDSFMLHYTGFIQIPEHDTIRLTVSGDRLFPFAMSRARAIPTGVPPRPCSLRQSSPRRASSFMPSDGVKSTSDSAAMMSASAASTWCNSSSVTPLASASSINARDRSGLRPMDCKVWSAITSEISPDVRLSRPSWNGWNRFGQRSRQQTFSLELLDRSSPAFFAELVRQMEYAYAKATDGAVGTALIAGGTDGGNRTLTTGALAASRLFHSNPGLLAHKSDSNV